MAEHLSIHYFSFVRATIAGIVLLLICSIASNEVSGQEPVVYDTSYYIWQGFDNPYVEQVESSSDIQVYSEKEHKGWLFIILIFCTIIYATVRYGFSKEFDSSIKAFKNVNLAQQLFRDREIIQNIPAILMNGGFVLAISVLIYHLVYYFGGRVPVNPLVFILITALFCGSLILVRISLIRFLGWLLPVKHKTDHYVFTLMLANRINGLILLPFLFIISFSNPWISQLFVPLALGVVLFFILYKIFRGFKLVNEFFTLDKMHLFLYICTFEISPVLVIAKLLSQNLNWIFT